MADGFLLSEESVKTISKVVRRVNGPQGSPQTNRRTVLDTSELKHVRLLAAEPTPTGDLVGYTAEVLKMDLSTNTLIATGITFDPNGDTEDNTIVKKYVYEVNARTDLANKVGAATFKYSVDEDISGAWVFSGGGGGSKPYIIITTSTDVNNYIADIITPTSATVITSGITVKALEPDAGQKLPVGRKMFVAEVVDDVYYIQPAVAYGS